MWGVGLVKCFEQTPKSLISNGTVQIFLHQMGLEMWSSDWNRMFLSVTYKSIGFNIPLGDKMFWSNLEGSGPSIWICPKYPMLVLVLVRLSYPKCLHNCCQSELYYYFLLFHKGPGKTSKYTEAQHVNTRIFMIWIGALWEDPLLRRGS